jgi:hypothetical protein
VKRVVLGIVAVALLLLPITCTADDGMGARSKEPARTTERDDVPIPPITAAPGGVRIDPADWRRTWRTTHGNDTGACVTVKRRRTYRSGELIAGNFQSFIEVTSSPDEQGSKLFFIPLHPDDSRPTLRVSAIKLDGAPASTLSFEFPTNSWTTDGWPFYATGTDLPPEPGMWRIIATTGRNQGCFDVSIPC